MNGDVIAVALMMYHALGNLPCGCCRRFDKETKEGFTVTHHCHRCRAMRAYEALAIKPLAVVRECHACE